MKINLDNKCYDVVVKRKSIKHIYIKTEGSTIVVSAGKRVSLKRIEDLVLENKVKVLRMLNKSVKEENEGSKFYYLGTNYDIIIMPTSSDIVFDEGYIIVKSEEFLNSFLKKKTEEILHDRFNYVYSIFEEDIPKYRLRIRKMKTRWGVCNKSSRTITLNSNLIKYDKSVIDYVIIHELSHLVHFNHSKNFWDLVKKHDSDYKKHRKILKG